METPEDVNANQQQPIVSQSSTVRDVSVLRSARSEILRRKKFAKQARLDAARDGNESLAQFHLGVYSGLSMAAGIAFRELLKLRRRSG